MFASGVGRGQAPAGGSPQSAWRVGSEEPAAGAAQVPPRKPFGFDEPRQGDVEDDGGVYEVAERRVGDPAFLEALVRRDR